jgi:hypothetical protein
MFLGLSAALLSALHHEGMRGNSIRNQEGNVGTTAFMSGLKAVGDVAGVNISFVPKFNLTMQAVYNDWMHATRSAPHAIGIRFTT